MQVSEAQELQLLGRAARREEAVERWIPRVVALVALFLVAAPLLTVTVASFRPGLTLPFQAGEWTLGNFVEAFGSLFTYRLLLNTFLYAFASLAVGLSIALVFAWLVERTDMPYASSIYTLLLIPMAVPSLLKALGWVLLLGPRQGIINLFLRDLLGLNTPVGPLNIYSFAGMVFLTALSVVPTMFLMLGPLLRNINPSFEEAAETSGVGILNTLRKVTLPLISPGILAVIMYFVIVMIESFEIPLAIGLNAKFPVLSLQIYILSRGEHLPHYGLASSYSFLGLVLGILLLYAYRRATANAQRFAVITGKGYTQKRFALGRGKYLALGFIGLYLMLAVILPVGVLLWGSLLDFYRPPSQAALAHISLTNYVEIFRSPRIILAATNTLILFLSAASLTVFLALLISWVIHRHQSYFSAALDNAVFLPLAVPSIVIALGVMLFYLPTPLWGTIWIIVLGQIIRYLPFGARTISAAILQIHQELEEAAWASGASKLTTLRRVTLPLLLPAVWNSWLWVAIHSMRDFTFPLMLISYTNVVITSLLWSLWEQGRLTGMSAMAVLLILVSAFLSVASRRVAPRLGI
ncbi:MAG: iron ABC transporter permease [Deltaproteobacteria bacterium]|nr:iron ABC transporter permease [Deltaproteobacteria bacterium]